MMTIGQPTPVNYYRGTAKPGVNYDAGEFLESMRPDVEEVLNICAIRFGDCIPSCSSQHARAIACATAIRRDPFKLIGGFRLLRVLNNFLAVHATVTIMESQ
jgi:hypothetical protein